MTRCALPIGQRLVVHLLQVGVVAASVVGRAGAGDLI